MHAANRHIRTFTLCLLLTLGSGGYDSAACSPSTYSDCWQQRETCLVNGGDEDVCNTEYFECLARRGCG